MIAARVALIALVAGLAIAGVATAAPHKILVLPVDGTADAGTRARLTARIVKQARTLDGQVATAEATFADTALAVGCDPDAAGCSDLVMTTLGVDELVWGTATKLRGQSHLVVRRASKGSPPRDVSTTIAAGDPSERIDAVVAPVFAPPVEPVAAPPAPAAAAAAPAAAPVPAPEAAAAAAIGEPAMPAQPGPYDTRDRNRGITFAVGGGVALVLGVALLASYSSLQGSIDDHPTRTRADFDDLTALETKAQTRAIAGDALIVVGLAAAGLGGYYLYRDHHHRRSRGGLSIAPAAIGRAGLVLTFTPAGGGP